MFPNSILKKRTKSIFIGKPWPLGSTITSRGVNFCVAAPRAKQVDLILFRSPNDIEAQEIINLNKGHCSGDYWHVEVEGLAIGCCYGYRVIETNNEITARNYAKKILIDPCARALGGWDLYHRDAGIGTDSNIKNCLKSIVCERDEFDFTSHPRPRHKWNKSIIYELHVGAFTSSIESNIECRKKGTFLGLIDKLDYLKKLGITAIELLPVYAFDSNDAPQGLVNYWGYSPLNWFTPHHKYVMGDEPLDARSQFRELVAACHDKGIEVILDVVYNHTTEGNEKGPTLSWRGFDSNLYYYQDKEGKYQDVTGCGNTINANNPLVRKIIIESLRCWAIELGVDGFRFDLGIALSRGENLSPLDHPPLFEEIESDPFLSDLKLISEPWDCGGLYKLGDFPAKRVGTWNGKYRDGIRRFWKGDKNTVWNLKDLLNGSQEIYNGSYSKILRSINFITSHDGFTLNDLVSFNSKHNLSNGEDNCDGDNHNNSWNHGIEGPSTDLNLIALRSRQKKNFLTTLLLTPGVPMILMGDEVSRSQGGNNNSWCQNSPLGWMIWDKEKIDSDILTYTKKLLIVRDQLSELFTPIEPHSEKYLEDLIDTQKLWIQWHGVKLYKPDWSNWSHTISYSLNLGKNGSVMWAGFNAYNKKIVFELPKPINSWELLLNTSKGNPQDLSGKMNQLSNQKEIEIESRSQIILVAKKYYQKLKLSQ